jgi:hypothetical protein
VSHFIPGSYTHLTRRPHSEYFKHGLSKITNELAQYNIGRGTTIKSRSCDIDCQPQANTSLSQITTADLDCLDSSERMKTNEKVLKWLESVVTPGPDDMDAAELLNRARESLDEDERPLLSSTQKEYMTGPFRTISISPSVSVYQEAIKCRRDTAISKLHLFRKS